MLFPSPQNHLSRFTGLLRVPLMVTLRPTITGGRRVISRPGSGGPPIRTASVRCTTRPSLVNALTITLYKPRRR